VMSHGSSQRANPVLAVAVIIYASYALLALTIPQGPVNWARDFNPGAAQDVILAGVEGLQAISMRLGLDRPYRICRDLFLRATGKFD
jgi:hypothetical protein